MNNETSTALLIMAMESTMLTVQVMPPVCNA